MTKHDLIFSNRFNCRISRHLLFWLVFTFHVLVFRYYLYDLKYLALFSTYVIRFQNLLLFLPVSIFYAYFALYFLLPKYILKGRYFQLFIVVFLLSISLLLLSYYLSTLFNIRLSWDIPLKRQTIVRQIDFTIHNGLVCPLTVSTFAIGIKMAKNWYLQQRENDELLKQKIKKEVQLLKAQIHPAFLFHSLDAVYRDTLNGFERSPAMILKLSDLLSYILYESNEEKVPLEKELNLVEEYLALKKLCYKDAIQLSAANIIRPEGLQIAPLLLLPILESLLEQDFINKNGQTNINVDMNINGNNFSFIATLKADQTISHDFKSHEKLKQVQKRLLALYTNSYIFSITVTGSKLVVALNVLLEGQPAVADIITEQINVVV